MHREKGNETIWDVRIRSNFQGDSPVSRYTESKLYGGRLPTPGNVGLFWRGTPRKILFNINMLCVVVLEILERATIVLSMPMHACELATANEQNVVAGVRKRRRDVSAGSQAQIF
jgi:hypothetical protein